MLTHQSTSKNLLDLFRAAAIPSENRAGKSDSLPGNLVAKFLDEKDIKSLKMSNRAFIEKFNIPQYRVAWGVSAYNKEYLSCLHSEVEEKSCLNCRGKSANEAN